ncbi:MAG TPA: ROK family transcriptional regulator, partial [Polyangiaceae bacterium]|nr:ROK family transcriptional regulator [Polyangiaceae bacterium]
MELVPVAPGEPMRPGFPRERLQAACATMPGLVDAASGRVALSPNLGWRDVPIREMLCAALGVA